MSYEGSEIKLRTEPRISFNCFIVLFLSKTVNYGLYFKPVTVSFFNSSHNIGTLAVRDPS